MSNRLFQSVIHQMKDAVDRVIAVVDENNVIIACSELVKIGEVMQGVREEMVYSAEITSVGGYTYRPLASGAKNEYVVFVEGEDKMADRMSKLLSISLGNIKNLYDEKYDKGSFIKNFYPEEWMRTGSDIDILIHKENLGDIEKLFTEKLSYKTGITGNHDMGFNTPSGAHIEMHYKLIAGENAVTEVLGKIWEEASPKADMEYHYEMSEEMFVFYHIAHMAKHFRHGGCGIRYFIDL